MRHISNCFGHQLGELNQHLIQLEKLNEVIQHYLPENLARFCKVASFNKGCLVLSCSDPVWASQLRFLLPELRDTLRKNESLYQLVAIKIILTEAMMPTSSLKHAKHLSKQAQDAILKSAQQCEYEPLKQALHQLALNHEGKST